MGSVGDRGVSWRWGPGGGGASGGWGVSVSKCCVGMDGRPGEWLDGCIGVWGVNACMLF